MTCFSARAERLHQLQKIRPQYAEVYEFYRGLYAFLEKEEGEWFSCQPDLPGWPSRCQAGFPLLVGKSLAIEETPARAFLGRLIRQLSRLGHEGREDLEALREALDQGTLEVGSLLRASLERDRMPIVQASESSGAQPAVLEFVLSTTLSHSLQRWLSENLPPAAEGWKKGYCPVCGGTPVMGELCGDEGARVLHCATCLNQWKAPRLQCSYCGNTDTASLEYFTVEGETGYRVYICRKCSCYLKVIDTRELGEGLPMDVEDIFTLHLDMLAQREGFTRGKRQAAV